MGDLALRGWAYSEGYPIMNEQFSLLSAIRVNHSVSFISADFRPSLSVLIDIVGELKLRRRLNPLQVFHEIIPALSHKVSAIAKAVPGFRQ